MIKQVLLVEDDPDDQYNFLDAVQCIDGSIRCKAVETAGQAFDYLDGLVNLPDLIFVDINMPAMNGLDWLAQLRCERRYAKLPVVMVTSADDDGCRATAAKLSAGYVLKEASFSRLISTLTPFLHPDSPA